MVYIETNTHQSHFIWPWFLIYRQSNLNLGFSAKHKGNNLFELSLVSPLTMTDHHQDPNQKLPSSSKKTPTQVNTEANFSGQNIRYPNPPDAANPDQATLREQWRFAIRQYSKWYSHAWGTAILAGVSLFALGWIIKGSNPLPSLHDKPPESSSDSSSSSSSSANDANEARRWWWVSSLFSCFDYFAFWVSGHVGFEGTFDGFLSILNIVFAIMWIMIVLFEKWTLGLGNSYWLILISMFRIEFGFCRMGGEGLVVCLNCSSFKPSDLNSEGLII